MEITIEPWVSIGLEAHFATCTIVQDITSIEDTDHIIIIFPVGICLRKPIFLSTLGFDPARWINSTIIKPSVPPDITFATWYL